MESDKNEGLVRHAEREGERRRRPYVRPTVEVLGTMEDLTLGGSGSQFDKGPLPTKV